MNKRIETIPAQMMEALMRRDWPGNIRELQHVIERAVILSPTTVLQLPRDGFELPTGEHPGKSTTLQEAERQHILVALKDCGWVIGGPHGVACPPSSYTSPI